MCHQRLSDVGWISYQSLSDCVLTCPQCPFAFLASAWGQLLCVHNVCNVYLCGTCFSSMVALIQHQTVHTFKLPVLDLSSPQGRNQHSVLGPADGCVVWSTERKWKKWVTHLKWVPISHPKKQNYRLAYAFAHQSSCRLHVCVHPYKIKKLKEFKKRFLVYFLAKWSCPGRTQMPSWIQTLYQ